MLEEYGLIIVVICLILLFLGFTTGNIQHNVFGHINNTVDRMNGMVADGQLNMNGNGGKILYKEETEESFVFDGKLKLNGTKGNDISTYVAQRAGYTFTGWYDQVEGGELVYDKNGKSVDGEYWQDGKYQRHAGLIVYAHWKANSYHLDLNGILNGEEIVDGNLGDIATCDIYINGEKVAGGVNDYWWPTWETGSKFEIKNIKIKDGYKYLGVMNGDKEGSLFGTIVDKDVRVDLRFVKEDAKFYLDLNGILDGDEISDGSLGNIATCDVYIDGKKVASDVTDFYEAVQTGSTFEIKNIKVKDGYNFVGVMNGDKEGGLKGVIEDKAVRCDLVIKSS